MAKKELSQTPEAIASRARRLSEREAKAKAAGRDGGGGGGGNGDGDDDGGGNGDSKPSTASIGVASKSGESQAYHCGNCEEDVTMGMANCPTCGESLHWSGF